jgi:hypothetical protein
MVILAASDFDNRSRQHGADFETVSGNRYVFGLLLLDDFCREPYVWLRFRGVEFLTASTASENHAPAFESIAACRAKAANLMLAVSCGPLVHDDAEIVSAFRTASKKIFSHL